MLTRPMFLFNDVTAVLRLLQRSLGPILKLWIVYWKRKQNCPSKHLFFDTEKHPSIIYPTALKTACALQGFLIPADQQSSPFSRLKTSRDPCISAPVVLSLTPMLTCRSHLHVTLLRYHLYQHVNFLLKPSRDFLTSSRLPHPTTTANICFT